MDPTLICQLIAAILFVLAAFGISSPKINLMAMGLVFLTISFMI